MLNRNLKTIREFNMSSLNSLSILDKKIGSCTICKTFTPTVKHDNLKRGTKSHIMIIGQAPGKSEVRNGRYDSSRFGAGKALGCRGGSIYRYFQTDVFGRAHGYGHADFGQSGSIALD